MDETLRLFQFFILKDLEEPQRWGKQVLPVGSSASRREQWFPWRARRAMAVAAVSSPPPVISAVIDRRYGGATAKAERQRPREERTLLWLHR